MAVAVALTMAMVVVVAQHTVDPDVGRPQRPAALTVVGLGDSVPAGTACGCTSYVALVGRQIAGQEQRAADVDNLARPGQTSSGLLRQLADTKTRAALARAGLVIVTIGANDFDPSRLTAPDCPVAQILSCYADPLSELRKNLTTELTQVSSLLPAGGRVLVTGYWNDFLDGVVGQRKGAQYVATSDAVTRASNAVTATVSAATRTQYVDIYTPFKGSDGTRDCTTLLAADGDHPSPAGHRLIAATLVQALQPATALS